MDDLEKQRHKRAKPIAEQGNQKLMQLDRADKMYRILIKDFLTLRPDKEEIIKALNQIKNILASEIKQLYTNKLNRILQPVKQENIAQPANEETTLSSPIDTSGEL